MSTEQRRHHPIFYKYCRWRGHSTGEFRIEFPGVFTRPKFYHEFKAVPQGFHETQYVQGGGQYVEWIFLLEALYSQRSSDAFVFAEIGAGWGAWAVRAYASYRQISEGTMKIIAVEADSRHYEYMLEHFADNGIETKNHTLRQVAVSNRNGSIAFNVETNPYAQHVLHIDMGNHVMGEEFCGGNDRGVIHVECVTLEDVLADAEFVDFLHVDVQGEELKIIETSINTIRKKVSRLQIGTHSSELHDDIKRILTASGFRSVYDFGWREEAIVPYWGKIQFQDGCQSWENSALVGNEPNLLSFTDYESHSGAEAILPPPNKLHQTSFSQSAAPNLLPNQETIGGGGLWKYWPRPEDLTIVISEEVFRGHRVSQIRHQTKESRLYQVAPIEIEAEDRCGASLWMWADKPSSGRVRFGVARHGCSPFEGHFVPVTLTNEPQLVTVDITFNNSHEGVRLQLSMHGEVEFTAAGPYLWLERDKNRKQK